MGKRDADIKKDADYKHSGRRWLKALGFGAIFLVAFVLIASGWGPMTVTRAQHARTCWSSEPSTFLEDTNHKELRTIVSIGSEIIITGQKISTKKMSKDIKPWTAHATRGSRGSIVADFSSVDGPKALYGICAVGGNIVWADGSVWVRAARLSELLAAGGQLAVLAAAEIKTSHATMIKERKELIGEDKQQPDRIGVKEGSASEGDRGTTPTGSEKKPLRIGGGRGGGPSRIKATTDEGVPEAVTLADTRSNEILVNGHRNRFPGVSILTEESRPPLLPNVLKGLPLMLPFRLDEDPVYPLRDVTIVIDPLDATKEFTEELLSYVTTQQCIVVDGRPVAGIIHQPFGAGGPTMGVGRHVFGDLRRTDGSKKDMTSHTVTFSRSHAGSAQDIVTSRFGRNVKSLQAGGAGYKALLVVSGQVDGYLHVTKSKVWDTCAADALIHAMGGKFTDTRGSLLKYDPQAPVLTHGFIGAGSDASHDFYMSRLIAEPIAELQGSSTDMPPETSFEHTR